MNWDVMAVIGLVLIVVGCAWVLPALGVIALGGVLVTVAIVGARR